ncbi:hypothetical protein Bca4012_072522 [Brassica carinata]|uniref:Uncharacterized protein n=1 Tax=Brassica carinata TaxID=52824 RepID=A0A8X7QHP8_BRACI|nr:hypothetical protein Bca52824_064892 [Brassica carinata]
MNQTLGDSNPYYYRMVREQMAVREAAGKAMELCKAALVEASWCTTTRKKSSRNKNSIRSSYPRLGQFASDGQSMFKNRSGS